MVNKQEGGPGQRFVGAKSGTFFELPIRLPEGWKAKATPERTLVILEYWSLGQYLAAVTIDEVGRTYAFGADARDSAMAPYKGRNWRVRLYQDAVDSLQRLIG